MRWLVLGSVFISIIYTVLIATLQVVVVPSNHVADTWWEQAG